MWSFATGLAGGAAYCVYHESLDFSHNIAAIAGNVTIAGVAFLSAKELTRLVRQTDDWMNSATAGAMVGSQLAVMQRGPRYSAAGAALCGGVAGAIHYAWESDKGSDSLWRALGFRAVIDPRTGQATDDWVTPRWFPVRRLTDAEAETNEINFQMRVQSVLDGRLSEEEAAGVREEYAAAGARRAAAARSTRVRPSSRRRMRTAARAAVAVVAAVVVVVVVIVIVRAAGSSRRTSPSVGPRVISSVSARGYE